MMSEAANNQDIIDCSDDENYGFKQNQVTVRTNTLFVVETET